jgi:VanZ family protein
VTRAPRAAPARAAYAALLVLWCLAVWRVSASSDPADEFVGVHLKVPDKVAHGVEFAIGGFLAAGAMPGLRTGGTWLPAVVFCGLWGTVDEIHQSAVPRREASGADLAADVAGAGLGALAFNLRPWRARRAPVPGLPAGAGPRDDVHAATGNPGQRRRS